MKLFLDDEREPYMIFADDDGSLTTEWRTWAIARTVGTAIELLETGRVEEISLDHDLGDGHRTGYDLCKWMSANDRWPVVVHFHSMNPIGVKNMVFEYRSYLKHKGLLDEPEEGTAEGTAEGDEDDQGQ